MIHDRKRAWVSNEGASENPTTADSRSSRAKLTTTGGGAAASLLRRHFSNESVSGRFIKIYRRLTIVDLAAMIKKMAAGGIMSAGTGVHRPSPLMDPNGEITPD